MSRMMVLFRRMWLRLWYGDKLSVLVTSAILIFAIYWLSGYFGNTSPPPSSVKVPAQYLKKQQELETTKLIYGGDSSVRGDGGGKGCEVRADSTYTIPEHKACKNCWHSKVSMDKMEVEKRQGMVDYLATKLDVKYRVVTNIATDKYFTAQIVLTNTGNKVIDSSSEWSMYFYSLPRIPPKNEKEVLISNERVLIRNIQGQLYEFTPTSLFPKVSPGVRETFEFTAERWAAARTDMFPNWYISAPGVQPQILTCTASESLPFFEPLERPEQLKRKASDPYLPWTPEERYDQNPPEDRSDMGRIVPTPLSLEIADKAKEIVITEGWTVFCKDKDYMREAAQLAEILGLPSEQGSPSSATSRVIQLTNATLAEEEYKMEAKGKRIDIYASSKRGFHYAVVSLAAILGITQQSRQSAMKMPELSLHDRPRFGYRGFMLDVARNFFPAPAVRKVMDVMEMYKMNSLHLHLSDDEGWRLEIRDLPELTQVGGRRGHDLSEHISIVPQLGSGPFSNTSGSGYYSIADYQSILHYANLKHIEVIPEIDMPGHCHAAIKAMESRHASMSGSHTQAEAEEYLLSDPEDTSQYSSPQAFTDGAMNPCLDSSFRFVEHILQALIDIHSPIQPLRTFHFGGDEVAKGAFENSPACKAYLRDHPELTSTQDIKRHFVHRIGALAASKGLSLQGWNDGFNGQNNAPKAREEFENKDVFVNTWLNMRRHGQMNNTHSMANDGYKMIISYATHLYFDHPHEPDPEERGLYWASRYIDTRKVFELIAGDIYAAEEEDLWGTKQIYSPGVTLEKPENIVGLQALIWSETIRSTSHLHNMLLPRLLAAAERAWHTPSWENGRGKDPPVDAEQRTKAWNKFANTLGQREMARLEEMGFETYLPPPGAKRTSPSSLSVNCAYPGLAIEYSSDSGQTWHVAEKNTVQLAKQKNPLLRTRSPSIRKKPPRYSRTITVSE